MKIAIDATPLLPKPSGIGWYVASLIQALEGLKSQEAFELEVVYQPGLKNWLKGDRAVPNHLRGYSNLRLFPLPVRLTNFLVRFPGLFTPGLEGCFGAPDIVHGTNYTVFPFRHSRRVMTLYDLTFIRYPQYTNSTVSAYADRVKKCLQWTDLILTISQSSKNDIVHYLGVQPDRVWVTPLASRYHANALSFDCAREASIHYDFSKPYILFVSTIEPRKNIINLIEAFDYLKQKYRLDHDLILIGQKGWLYEPIFERIARSPYQKSIHHLSYLSDQLVALFYSKADVFVYPSHYEGFGLPVLEAMTLGAPVVAANASSLPEVAGDAALFFDPNDVIDLAETILRVVSDAHLRQELIQKGRARATHYSWEKTARETLKAYKLLMS